MYHSWVGTWRNKQEKEVNQSIKADHQQRDKLWPLLLSQLPYSLIPPLPDTKW
jgi:hypothetical protein